MESKAVQTIVESNRNPYRDIWGLFSAGQITKEDLEVRVKRRSIENLRNWYFPRKITGTNLDPQVTMIILRDLVAHNNAIVSYLLSLTLYANDEEIARIYGKVDDYKAIIYKQEQSLRELKLLTSAKKKGGLNL